jgi:hypothetical protein
MSPLPGKQYPAHMHNHTLHYTTKAPLPQGCFLQHIIHSKKIIRKGENTIEKFLTSSLLRSRTLLKHGAHCPALILPVSKTTNRTILLFQKLLLCQ